MSLPIPAQFRLVPVAGLLNGPVLSDSAPAVLEDLDGDKSVLGEQGQMLMLAVRLLAMGGRVRGLWPFVVVGAIAVVTTAGLVAVWRSPHRDELEGFAGLAISVTGIAAGWMAWVWRARSQQASGAVSGQESGRLAELLAGSVDEEWTRAAGERGLLEPVPIPVRWQRPAASFAGPAAAAVASTRFAPLPGLPATGSSGCGRARWVSCMRCTGDWGRGGW